VQRAAERDHTASTTIDTDVGIAALAEQGIITRVKDDIWAFTKASFQDAIYRLVARRDREHIHGSALAYWQSLADKRDSDRVWASIARHAGACGARDIAADAHLEFADRARREHRYVEADLYYTSALPFTDEGDHTRRACALGGRGRVRYRMQRVQESIDDLRRAQDHARALDDLELTAEYMLEEATALQWESRFAESAQRVEDARALVPEPGSVRLAGRLLMAEGRSHYRAGRSNEAIALLTRAVALAGTVGDDETRIIAFPLLAVLLAIAGEFDRAQDHFDEVIALCERTGDRFHLCVAYNNRAAVWSARNSLGNLYADLRRTIQLAREVGQPILERGAAHNLAEYLYWSGQYEDALALARRAYHLRRFLPEPVAVDALLLARILAAYQRPDEARAMVDEARHLANSGEPSISDELVIKMLDLALSEASERSSSALDALTRDSQQRLPGEEYLETLFFRARAALQLGHWSVLGDILRAARDKLDEYPVWTAPFEHLEASTPSARSSDQEPAS
jgi:tetratricopeptide (TPR) repeat protein